MMKRHFLTLAAIFFCTIIIAQPKPSFYTGCNGQGKTVQLDAGKYAKLKGAVGNDAIKGVYVSSGWVVECYEDENFKGRSIRLTGDDPCFDPSWQNRVSSIIITRDDGTASGEVQIYEDCDYKGISASFGEGNYDKFNLKGLHNDAISSLRIPNGYSVELFPDEGFKGRSTLLTCDSPCLPSNWNNVTSSIKVYRN